MEDGLRTDKKLDKSRMSREEVKKELKRRKDRDSQSVRGVFRFHEVPGGTLSFTYSAYGEDARRYDLTDGNIYEIPLGVARHLNSNVWYPEHAFLMDKDNKPQMQLSKKVRRASFQSLEFMDIEDGQSNADIVTARPL